MFVIWLRARNEIDELKLDNRPQPGDCRAERGINQRAFGDRRIDYASLAEVVSESFGDVERAAIHADVFAHAKHGRVSLHLFPQTLANRFEIGDGSHVYLKCSAASLCLGAERFSADAFTPYFGLISWQVPSQKPPPAAVCGSGIGEATANSRSASSSASTPSINFWFCSGVSHFFSSKYASKRAIGSRFCQNSNSGRGTYCAASWMAWPFMRIIFASISVGPSPRRARSEASCATSYTWHASVPSTITPGIPMRARCMTSRMKPV